MSRQKILPHIRMAMSLFAGILAIGFSGVVQAQAPSMRMSPATAPAGMDVPDAQWGKLEGPGKHKFLLAILRPKTAGPFPAVVVLHGADGLVESYLQVAEELARAGFLVVIGCWQAANYVCAEATPQSEWVADPAANSGKELIAFAKTLPDVRSDRIGLYGMSRGGHAALWAAATGADVQAVVVDAPAHSPATFPAPASTLKIVGQVNVPLLIMHGTADSVSSVDQSREYERAARALKKPITVKYFKGVGHITSVQPSSQAAARSQAIAFLREKLKLR